jgi:hypothetical protein
MTPFPAEFRRLPIAPPPDWLASNNPEHNWVIGTDWRTPPVDGKQVVFRAGYWGTDGLYHGFYNDGVSAPRWTWSLLGIYPYQPEALMYGIGHDGMYAGELADRPACDGCMKAWAEMAQHNQAYCQTVYRAVRLGGGYIWDTHTPESIALSRQFCQLVNAGETPVWAD